MKVEFTEWYDGQPITIEMLDVVAVRKVMRNKYSHQTGEATKTEGAIITTLHGAEFTVEESYDNVLFAWPPREQVMVKHIPTSGE